MRAEARLITETTDRGREVEKVAFTFTISLRQMASMSEEEIVALMTRMSRYHVAGAKRHADSKGY